VIGAVLRKELTEARRDGRILGIVGLIGLLVLISLATGASTHVAQQRIARRAQLDDQATFQVQGSKAPHAAAHFGRMAYKTPPPLAVFDPGAAPYLGQAIWLEAHRRDPAMFRPAEDSPELRRLGDASVAGVLTLLLPLLAFVMGYGAFASERERGTLRLVLSMARGVDGVFAGKLCAVAAIAVSVATGVVCVSILVAMPGTGETSPWDTIARGAGLVAGYGLYAFTCAAVALLVSARSRSAAPALATLLGLWAVSVVILPRVAASVAERVHPTPDGTAFWADVSGAVRARRPDGDSREYHAVEQRVVSRALGRDVEIEELASLELNRQALSLEVGEVLGAEAHAGAYRALYETHASQRRLRRWMSLLSPTIALQHLSSAIAGTDVSAHEHFAREAERQRALIVRRMNEDMMLHGAGQGFDYVAGPELWARIPDFAYAPPTASAAFRSALWDLLVLVSWSLAAPCLAWRAARRQSVA
jgi:ABC-2 type transport system permease protein